MEEIRESWRRTCEDNRDHSRAAELFDPDKLPAFHDPFAGGGSIPLEAQRLGLEAHASDLNPVAVLINKAMIEIPPKFAGKVASEPRSPKRQGLNRTPSGRAPPGWRRTSAITASGCVAKLRRASATCIPRLEVTAYMARERPDLKQYVGRKLTVIAWLWARTVKSPNPAFARCGRASSVHLRALHEEGHGSLRRASDPEGGSYHFIVKAGVPPESAKNGTTAGKRSAFLCLMSSVPLTYEHIRAEGKAGRMGARLMTIVAEGDRGRVYLGPTPEHEAVANNAHSGWKPDIALPNNPRGLQDAALRNEFLCRSFHRPPAGGGYHILGSSGRSTGACLCRFRSGSNAERRSAFEGWRSGGDRVRGGGGGVFGVRGGPYGQHALHNRTLDCR